MTTEETTMKERLSVSLAMEMKYRDLFLSFAFWVGGAIGYENATFWLIQWPLMAIAIIGAIVFIGHLTDLIKK